MLHLGSSKKNACVKQSLTGLKHSLYYLEFDYAPVLSLINNSINEAYFIVKFNGRNVKNILPLDQYSNH